MKLTTASPVRPTLGLRQGPSQSKLNRLGAAVAGNDYMAGAAAHGYRLGVSDALMHAASGFFQEEPAARGLSLGERAAVVSKGLERLRVTTPELFRLEPGDDFHARLEKTKLNDAVSMLNQVTVTGKLPERGWSANATRALVGHMIVADDR
jgi:hypothetical protein